MVKCSSNYQGFQVKGLTWNCAMMDVTVTGLSHFRATHCGLPWSLFQHVSGELSNRCCFPSSRVFLPSTELTRHSASVTKDSSAIFVVLWCSNFWLFSTAKIVRLLYYFYLMIYFFLLPCQHLRSLAVYSKYRDMVRLGGEPPWQRKVIQHYDKISWWKG